MAIYDVVLRDGNVVYPTPWTGDASMSFLLSESETRTALEAVGHKAVLWRDDTQVAMRHAVGSGVLRSSMDQPRYGFRQRGLSSASSLMASSLIMSHWLRFTAPSDAFLRSTISSDDIAVPNTR